MKLPVLLWHECVDLRLALHHILEALEHPHVMRLFGVCVGVPPPSWPTGLQPPAICCELPNISTAVSAATGTGVAI